VFHDIAWEEAFKRLKSDDNQSQTDAALGRTAAFNRYMLESLKVP
jgi:hypothetical protein